MTLSPDARYAHTIESNHLHNWLYWGRWSGMKVVEEPHLIWTLSDVPSPLFNNVLIPRLPTDRVGHAILDSQGRARVRKVPTCWQLGPSSSPTSLARELEAAGFKPWCSQAGMALKLKDLDTSDPQVPEAQIRRVNDASSLRQFCDMVSKRSGFDPATSKAWFKLVQDLGLEQQGPLHLYLALRGREPVATTSLFIHQKVAGLSFVETSLEQEAQAWLSTLVSQALREARSLGCWLGCAYAPAGLQGLLERLGFRHYGDLRSFTWAPAV